MLSIIGTALNMGALGIMFPIIMLPLAKLIAARFDRSQFVQNFIWFVLTLGSAFLLAILLRLSPGLKIPPSSAVFLTLGGGLTGLSAFFALTSGINLWTDRLSNIARQLAIRVGTGVMWLILVMALVQFTIVILRYVFGISFIWMQESILYLHGAVFLLAAGYALTTDDHVRVDLFYREASETRKAWVNLFGTYGLLIPVCFLILWAGAPYVFASWDATEGSNESSGVQLLFILKSLIPAFAVFMLLAGVDLANRSVSVLLGYRAGEQS